MELKTKIKLILEPVIGITASTGKEWKKINFITYDNNGHEGREQIYCFEIFGADKVDKFQQYNNAGDDVDVSFNIRTNEHKGNYYTSLQAWRVQKSDNNISESFAPAPDVSNEPDDLPF